MSDGGKVSPLANSADQSESKAEPKKMQISDIKKPKGKVLFLPVLL